MGWKNCGGSSRRCEQESQKLVFRGKDDWNWDFGEDTLLVMTRLAYNHGNGWFKWYKRKKIKKEVNQETGVLYGSSELILKSPNILVNVM